jgi:hypothetical protein
MPTYTYRTLRVRVSDKHRDNPDRKRRGEEPDRILTIDDSQLDELIDFVDEEEDDFRQGAYSDLLEYLNDLGRAGWRVVVGPTTNPQPRFEPFLNGDFLLMRSE